MIPTKAYAVHNATGDPLRNNSVQVGPGHGIEDRESIAAVAKFVGEAVSGTECTDQQRRHHEGGQRAKCCGRRPRVLDRDDEPARTRPNDLRTHRTFETTTCSPGNSRDLRNCVCPAGCHGGLQRHQGGPPPRSRFRNGTCSKTPASRFWN